MRELFDVEPSFVSLVENGANRKKFKIFKSTDSKGAGHKEGRYEELAKKFYKEGLGEQIKELIKGWFDRMRKAQDEIDNEEKGGRIMNKEEEKKAEELKKAKAEEARIKAEKEAKEQEEKEKADKELKGRVAEAVASILQGKENLEELKGLIAKVEKGEEIKPEEVIKLKEALGVKEEKSKEEKDKEIEGLKARIEKLENPKGKKKSIDGQDDEPKPKKWKSFQG